MNKSRVIMYCISQYVDGLGVGNSFQFCDVFGLDPDLLMMIPQPCAALVMLFPITDRLFEKRKKRRLRKKDRILSF
uniref:ubiquitinyl hydrolase 1 n=1 Tax=Amphimedon queenslandica TaxID=400682 RepID=A0A1X7TRW7_AMPQE